MDTKVFPIYSHIAKRGLSGDAAARVRSANQVAPWTATKARNGNPVLPDEVYEVLRQECAKFPGPVQHDETFALVLNNTACRTTQFGMGLSRKRGGRRVEHPDPRVGEVAEDILQHQNGHHWDVFGSAAIGNPLNPGQGPSIGIINLNDRPWVAPVCDAVVDPPEPPPVGPGEPAQPPPQPPGTTIDLSDVLTRLERIEANQRWQPSQQDLRNLQDALWGLIADKVIGEHIRELKEAVAAIGTGGEVSGGCRLPGWARALGAGALARAIEDSAKSDPERPQSGPADEPR